MKWTQNELNTKLGFKGQFKIAISQSEIWK
jgi:hypothetical protein